MLKRATQVGHHAAIGAIASAEIEARKGNGEKTLQYLARAGEWSFDTATQIGERGAL
jgi:hypothetical protein